MDRVEMKFGTKRLRFKKARLSSTWTRGAIRIETEGADRWRAIYILDELAYIEGKLRKTPQRALDSLRLVIMREAEAMRKLCE